MAKFDVLDMNGKKVSTVELSDAVFGITPNEKVMHAAVVNFLANQRQGTQSTKTRSEVRGGGRKPWRQKGTGRARQGSIRSPQWTHGGIALGPKPRDYSYTLNKKVKRLALLSSLSDKAQNGNLIVVDTLAVNEYKTKAVIDMLKAVGADTKRVLIATAELDSKLVKSANNIPGVKTTLANQVNTYEVLLAGKLVVSVDAAKKLEEVFA
ncbi:MAG: 50S ribosomal protein L4 [Oscillospiraceae bacterium]|nr:50S ribosomal protein L4 [Oscillospiraceae bacterium]